jgi:hypothetical protein
VADLSAVGRRLGPADDERGQIILIAAFAMAVTFVTLALVVNSAIFTENLASRGETSGSDDALLVRHEVERATGSAIEYANAHNATSNETLANSLRDSVATISAVTTEQHATGGKIVTVEGPTAIENGTQIRDESLGGSTFVNATVGGANETDWRVADGIAETRAYRMNVTGVNRTDNFGGPAAEQFQLIVTDSGGGTWTMNVTHENTATGGEYRVGVENAAGEEGYCAVDETVDYFHVDLTAGLVAGEPCPALSFGEGLSTPYDITYQEGDEVTGNYSVVVNDESVSSNDNLASSPGSDDPYWDEAIYAANVTFRYDGPDMTYETTVRAAPGEPA